MSELLGIQAVGREDPKSLRKLLDDVLKYLRALKALGEPVDSWDTLLIHLITNKLDQTSRREWEEKATTKGKITMQELEGFLVKKCEVLEAVKRDSLSYKQEYQGKERKGDTKVRTVYTAQISAH